MKHIQEVEGFLQYGVVGRLRHSVVDMRWGKGPVPVVRGRYR